MCLPKGGSRMGKREGGREMEWGWLGLDGRVEGWRGGGVEGWRGPLVVGLGSGCGGNG
jgi:hypothetical protein